MGTSPEEHREHEAISLKDLRRIVDAASDAIDEGDPDYARRTLCDLGFGEIARPELILSNIKAALIDPELKGGTDNQQVNPVTFAAHQGREKSRMQRYVPEDPLDFIADLYDRASPLAHAFSRWMSEHKKDPGELFTGTYFQVQGTTYDKRRRANAFCKHSIYFCRYKEKPCAIEIVISKKKRASAAKVVSDLDPGQSIINNFHVILHLVDVNSNETLAAYVASPELSKFQITSGGGPAPLNYRYPEARFTFSPASLSGRVELLSRINGEAAENIPSEILEQLNSEPGVWQPMARVPLSDSFVEAIEKTDLESDSELLLSSGMLDEFATAYERSEQYVGDFLFLGESVTTFTVPFRGSSR